MGKLGDGAQRNGDVQLVPVWHYLRMPIRLDDARLTLIGRLRRQSQLRHYSKRTEDAYVAWVRRYVQFHELKHPEHLGPVHLRNFLSALATTSKASAATQNQARAAVMFMYRDVLAQGTPWTEAVEIAKRPHRIPVVMTREEAHKVIGAMSGMCKLIALVLYGGGLRLNEAISLRVKDVDFAARTILVRDGKGSKDRLTVLPELLIAPLRAHLVRVERLWRIDMLKPNYVIPLPNAFATKAPHAVQELRWYWLFPAGRAYVDAKTRTLSRSHVHATVVQRSVSSAVRAVGLLKRATCHTFRHSFATHLLESGYDIRTTRFVTRANLAVFRVPLKHATEFRKSLGYFHNYLLHMTTIVLKTRIAAPIELCFDCTRDLAAHVHPRAQPKNALCIRPRRACSAVGSGHVLHRVFTSLQRVHEFRRWNAMVLMTARVTWRSPLGIIGRVADNSSSNVTRRSL